MKIKIIFFIGICALRTTREEVSQGSLDNRCHLTNLLFQENPERLPLQNPYSAVCCITSTQLSFPP